MLFVIFSETQIPGYGGLRGPVLTPQAYDLKQVLNWVAAGLDIREVMPDGSYRQCEFNDIRINKAMSEGYKYVNKTEPVVVEKPVENSNNKRHKNKQKGKETVTYKEDVKPVEKIDKPNISLDYEKKTLDESKKDNKKSDDDLIIDEIEDK